MSWEDGLRLNMKSSLKVSKNLALNLFKKALNIEL